MLALRCIACLVVMHEALSDQPMVKFSGLFLLELKEVDFSGSFVAI